MNVEGSALTRSVSPLIPAKAGIQRWVPACAGTRGQMRLAALISWGFVALALTACGRAGPLEPPPGPAAVPSAQVIQSDGSPAPGSPQDTAVKSGFDSQGNPVAAGQKRSFILDPLLR